jgi:hypothetical protein
MRAARCLYSGGSVRSCGVNLVIFFHHVTIMAAFLKKPLKLALVQLASGMS